MTSDKVHDRYEIRWALCVMALPPWPASQVVGHDRLLLSFSRLANFLLSEADSF